MLLFNPPPPPLNPPCLLTHPQHHTSHAAQRPVGRLTMEHAAAHNTQVYKGMTDAAVAICRDQGLRGLYRGLGVTLVEIVRVCVCVGGRGGGGMGRKQAWCCSAKLLLLALLLCSVEPAHP